MFKKQNVYRRKDMPYFDFFGHCKECNSKFDGVCMNEPFDSDPLRIKIETLDTSHIPHTKKRYLARDRRKIAKETLKNVKAKQYKNMESRKLVDNSDPIPAILSNSVVYQRARHEAIDESLKLENYPGTPLESLLAMMDILSDLKLISTNPFIVMYWSRQQINFWNELKDFDNADISVDASGSFVKRINIAKDNISSDIFLYVVVSRFAGKIYPLCQMLSDSHNTNTICNFLMRAKDDGAPTPKIITVDCSLALLNAISLAYNDCSYNQYLENCFYILRKVNSVPLPPCFIKRDRNHLIKNVTHWKCLQNKDWRVKDFYSRCIAYSLEVDDLKLLEEVLSCILIICQSKSIEVNTECYTKKQWITKKLETFSYKDVENPTQDGNINDSIIQIFESENEEQPAVILNYLYQLNSDCQIKSSSNITNDFPLPNFLECPEIVDNIISIYSQFPA